ncbi:transmembrane protein, putative [Medicago truncatula]|nr:transmembrane protein, putative [Medicago truncatula]
MSFINKFESSFSASLHHLQTKVSGENDYLLAVEFADGRSNGTVTLPKEVKKVKSREKKREEGLAGARSAMRKAALGNRRSNLTRSSTPYNDDGYIPTGAVYHNSRLFYQYISSSFIFFLVFINFFLSSFKIEFLYLFFLSSSLVARIQLSQGE